MDKLFENLIAPSVLGVVIQTLGAILVALLTRKLAKKAVPKQQANYFGWAVLGATTVITFVIIGLIFTWLTPKPTISITSPIPGQSIVVQLGNTAEGFFSITGTSERVHANEDLRVYVLIHPSKTTNWYLQPPIATNPDGGWSGNAQIGNQSFPPKVGDSLEVLAIAAYQNEVRKHLVADNAISDPKDLRPVAQSDRVSISIGSTVLPVK